MKNKLPPHLEPDIVLFSEVDFKYEYQGVQKQNSIANSPALGPSSLPSQQSALTPVPGCRPKARLCILRPASSAQTSSHLSGPFHPSSDAGTRVLGLHHALSLELNVYTWFAPRPLRLRWCSHQSAFPGSEASQVAEPDPRWTLISKTEPRTGLAWWFTALPDAASKVASSCTVHTDQCLPACCL